jgi:multidrug efflux pump subunit AcrA (membrane-fusion protein)
VAKVNGNQTTAQLRKIKTGISYNGEVVVTEGLQPGDQLITVGYQDLVDGLAAQNQRPDCRPGKEHLWI